MKYSISETAEYGDYHLTDPEKPVGIWVQRVNVVWETAKGIVDNDLI